MKWPQQDKWPRKYGEAILNNLAMIVVALVIIAALIVLISSMSTIGDQVNKAARANRVDSEENEKKALSDCIELCGAGSIKKIEYTIYTRTLKACECK